MLPMIFILRLRLVTVSTSAILHEVENQTWDTLRVTPLTAARIVRSKYAGALMRHRNTFYQVTVSYLTLVISGVYFFIVMRTTPSWHYLQLPNLASPAALAAAVIGALYLALEPALGYATDVAVGLGVGTLVSQQGDGLWVGAAAGVVAVGAQFWLNVELVNIFINEQWSLFCAAALLAAALRLFITNSILYATIARVRAM
jgi:hypothetical protein